jgi:hypothetical protein
MPGRAGEEAAMPEVTAGRPPQRVSGWAIGFTSFAGFLMIVGGIFHVMIGLAGLANNPVFVTSQNYIFKFNLTTWGWAHLIVGILVLAAGFAVFSGAVWARTVGVIIAGISMIANFAFLPYYPLWAILIIALDIGVIWALTAHGRDIAAGDTY